jgi:hypothetical protein
MELYPGNTMGHQCATLLSPGYCRLNMVAQDDIQVPSNDIPIPRYGDTEFPGTPPA